MNSCSSPSAAAKFVARAGAALLAVLSCTPFCLAGDVTAAQLNDLANRPKIVVGRNADLPDELNDPEIWQQWIEHEAAARGLTIAPEYRNIARVFKERAKAMRRQNDDGATVFWPAVLVQVVHETGFFQYKGDVPPRMTADGRPIRSGSGGVPTYNLTGLGVTLEEARKAREANRVPGETFDTLDKGVMASLQHIATYAGLKIKHDALVSERTKEVQGDVVSRAEGLQAKRGSDRPEITFADLGSHPVYRPGDPAIPLAIETVRKDGREKYIVPHDRINRLSEAIRLIKKGSLDWKWKVVDVEKNAAGVVERVKVAHATEDWEVWLSPHALIPVKDFPDFRSGSMNYAGDRNYGSKVLIHWLAAADYVREQAAVTPDPSDLAGQVELTPVMGPAEPPAITPPPGPGDLGKQVELVPPTPGGTPSEPPVRPDPDDLAKQVELVPPDRDARTTPPEKKTSTSEEESPPVEEVPEEIEPFYAVYSVHSIQFPELPKPPPNLTFNQIVAWMSAWIDERSVKDVQISLRPSGKIAYRVEGDLLDEFVQHSRQHKDKPFKYFRPGPYKQTLHMYHPKAGYVQLPPLCLSYRGATKELTDDIGGAYSYGAKIPGNAGALSNEKRRVAWSCDFGGDVRLDADPPAYDLRGGQNWSVAKREAIEGWKRIAQLTYLSLAK